MEIDADPNGLLKFLASSASATAGKVTLRMKNMSSTPHDIAVKGAGAVKKTFPQFYEMVGELAR